MLSVCLCLSLQTLSLTQHSFGPPLWASQAVSLPSSSTRSVLWKPPCSSQAWALSLSPARWSSPHAAPQQPVLTRLKPHAAYQVRGLSCCVLSSYFLPSKATFIFHLHLSSLFCLCLFSAAGQPESGGRGQPVVNAIRGDSALIGGRVEAILVTMTLLEKLQPPGLLHPYIYTRTHVALDNLVICLRAVI